MKPVIGRLNHVGVAVPNLEDACNVYRDMFGVTNITQPKILEEQGVRFAFVTVDNSEIELIEPYGENSPISKFLSKYPNGGQHHICYEVMDLIEARDHLCNKGATVLNDGKPRIGAHGVPILFFHPKNFNGILIELMEVSDNL